MQRALLGILAFLVIIASACARKPEAPQTDSGKFWLNEISSGRFGALGPHPVFARLSDSLSNLDDIEKKRIKETLLFDYERSEKNYEKMSFPKTRSILRGLYILDRKVAENMAEKLLKESKSEQVQTVALDLLQQNPRKLPLIRAYLKHRSELVAAKARAACLYIGGSDCQ